MPDPLLDTTRTGWLRAAVEGYTSESVHEALGLVGQAALSRGDLTGAARALRGRDDPLATLVRLFPLGRTVDAADAVRALAPLPPADALEAGLLVDAGGGRVRAGLDLRPYGETDGPDWWVVSDLGADVRPGPLRRDHVLGVGTASLTLAQAVPRGPVARALDIGTGSGVQALHLGTHCAEVVATDVSERALRLAATTAALSGASWDLRRGSLLEPVAGERFDLVVANPPFVVSDGAPGWEYRDGGAPGDTVSAELVRGLPAHLTPGGSAHLLANWTIRRDGDWRARVSGWLDGSGCDAWVWQREVAEPGEYVSLWLRDAGLTPGSSEWAARYDAWLDWFATHGVVAVGMGLVSLWRTDSTPHVVLEDVPQPLEQPIGAELGRWRERQRWLAAHPDDALLTARPRAAAGLVRDRSEILGDDGWGAGSDQLRQSYGMRWTVDTDAAVAGLVAACDGVTPLRRPIQVLAAALDRTADEIATAVLPVVRELVARGFLVPPDPTAGPDHGGTA